MVDGDDDGVYTESLVAVNRDFGRGRESISSLARERAPLSKADAICLLVQRLQSGTQEGRSEIPNELFLGDGG